MPDTALDQQYTSGATLAPTINLEWPERVASVALGTRMAFGGLSHMFRHPLRSAIRIFAGGYLVQRGVTGHCEVYTRLGKTTTEPVSITINYTFTVNRHRQDVYDFWRRLENLPLFMSHLDNIQIIDSTHSHWEAKIPGNIANISWDAEITEDVYGRAIGWQSMSDSIITNTGKITFGDAPGDQGTIVKVLISYTPPAGGVGTGIAKLLNPVFEKLVRQDVLSFKDYLETYSVDDRVKAGDDDIITIVSIDTQDDV